MKIKPTLDWKQINYITTSLSRNKTKGRAGHVCHYSGCDQVRGRTWQPQGASVSSPRTKLPRQVPRALKSGCDMFWDGRDS